MSVVRACEAGHKVGEEVAVLIVFIYDALGGLHFVSILTL
jgi:hypothetical protein